MKDLVSFAANGDSSQGNQFELCPELSCDQEPEVFSVVCNIWPRHPRARWLDIQATRSKVASCYLNYICIDGTLSWFLCVGINLPGKVSHVLEQASRCRVAGRRKKDRQTSQASLGALFFLVRLLGSINVWWPAAKPRHYEVASISSDFDL